MQDVRGDKLTLFFDGETSTLDAIGPELQGVLDAMPSYVLLVDSTHHIVASNRAVYEHLGVTPEELVGGYCPKVVHGVDGSYPGCPLEEAVTKGCAVERQIRDHASGRWVLSAIYPTRFQTSEGHPVFFHTVTDITDQKRAEAELEQSIEVQTTINAMLRTSLTDMPIEDHLKLILQQVTGMSWLTLEPAGSIFLVQDDPNVLVLKAQQGLAAPLLTACATVPFGHCLCGRAALSRESVFADDVDDRHDTQYDGMRPHGHYCVPILSASRVLGVINLYVRAGSPRNPSVEGCLRAVANVLANIVEHKRLEEQFFQAQKMEAVGRLAGGVAHDFNNMLTIINGYTDMGLDTLDPSDPLYTDLLEIRNAGQRSEALTRQLLAFARRQTIDPKVLDLNETVKGMFKMLQRLIGEDIALTWLPQAGLWPVKIDPSQVDQLLANLVVNARDAIAGVGKVTIKTGNVSMDESSCSANPGSVPGDYVQLMVSDDGCGMDKETLARIFEPFFTTKPVGQGTGLGLATVYGIVKQNNGFINVYSEIRKGTTANIYLPRDASQAVESPATMVARILHGHGETVLLVEDELGILHMAKRVLGSLGYQVLAAGTPGEAMRLAEEYMGEIHLLITDVVMPGMSGRELAQRLLCLYPTIKCLYMSGYTANVIAHQGVLDEGVTFIQKPFSPQALAAKVREVLDRKPTNG